MTSKKKTSASSRKAAKKPKSDAKKMPKVGETKKPLIRVLIADDHSVVREGLVSLITRKADMTVIGEAGNGREAVDLLEKHHPGGSLVGLGMPQMDGVGALKDIFGAGEETGNIVVKTCGRHE